MLLAIFDNFDCFFLLPFSFHKSNRNNYNLAKIAIFNIVI